MAFELKNYFERSEVIISKVKDRWGPTVGTDNATLEMQVRKAVVNTFSEYLTDDEWLEAAYKYLNIERSGKEPT